MVIEIVFQQHQMTFESRCQLSKTGSIRLFKQRRLQNSNIKLNQHSVQLSRITTSIGMRIESFVLLKFN